MGMQKKLRLTIFQTIEHRVEPAKTWKLKHMRSSLRKRRTSAEVCSTNQTLALQRLVLKRKLHHMQATSDRWNHLLMLKRLRNCWQIPKAKLLPCQGTTWPSSSIRPLNSSLRLYCSCKTKMIVWGLSLRRCESRFKWQIKRVPKLDSSNPRSSWIKRLWKTRGKP